jgi:uncharacterized protein (TIGR03435 family)
VRKTALLFTAVALPFCAPCQTPDAAPAFEVSSVKPSIPGAKTQIRRDPTGAFFAEAISLKQLILMAYNIQDYQLSNLPRVVATDRYDVIAKPPAGTKKEQTWVMLQTLLADRFKLAVHREEKELTVYALVVARNGPKFQETKRPPSEADDSIKFAPGHMICIMVPMADLALGLSSQIGHQVIDRTGIRGSYDLKLDWMPETKANVPGDPAASQPDGPTLFGALEDQLGLKLVPEKGPVEVVVVDHIEKPSEN